MILGSEKQALEGGVWEGRWNLIKDYFQSKYFEHYYNHRS
jgi:hypothetical protein